MQNDTFENYLLQTAVKQQEDSIENVKQYANTILTFFNSCFSEKILNSFSNIEINTDLDKCTCSWKATLPYRNTFIEFTLTPRSFDSLLSFINFDEERPYNKKYEVNVSLHTHYLGILKITGDQKTNDQTIQTSIPQFLSTADAIFASSDQKFLQNVPVSPNQYHSALQYLKSLEEEKIFLSPNVYETCKEKTQKVLDDYAELEKQKKIKFEENKKFVAECKASYETAYASYAIKMTALMLQLTTQYVKPWKLLEIVYIPSNIKYADLCNDDGTLVEDVYEALTYKVKALRLEEAVKNKIATCVNSFGKTFQRYIEGSIIHIDVQEMQYPTKPSEATYWKTIYLSDAPDEHKFCVYVPPETEVKPYQVPQRPKHWRETCADAGIANPYQYE